MATIDKQVGKNGMTYRITVYTGFDTQGRVCCKMRFCEIRSC